MMIPRPSELRFFNGRWILSERKSVKVKGGMQILEFDWSFKSGAFVSGRTGAAFYPGETSVRAIQASREY